MISKKDKVGIAQNWLFNIHMAFLQYFNHRKKLRMYDTFDCFWRFLISFKYLKFPYQFLACFDPQSIFNIFIATKTINLSRLQFQA